MGLFSWIKDKYNEHRFNIATRYISDGRTNEAIDILKDLLDKHPDAPEELLSIYHASVKTGDSTYVKPIAELYKVHKELKSSCIEFSRELERVKSGRIVIDYQQALFQNGLNEFRDSFVTNATAFVLKTSTVSTLTTLTTDHTLLSALSDSLFKELKTIASNVDEVDKSERLCLLILPYLRTTSFFNIYANVRFDKISQSCINETSIKMFDAIISDAKVKYNLGLNEIKHLTDKGLNLSKKLYSEKKYDESLLLSERLVQKSPDAGSIYVESAKKLYSARTNKSNLVKPDILYKAIGVEPTTLISGLEPFIPYGSYKEKYVDTVISTFKSNKQGQNSYLEDILLRAWNLTSSNKLIEAALSSNNQSNREHFASFILGKDNVFLNNSESLNSYVDSIINLQNREFVTTLFEKLLSNGKIVGKQYEDYILDSAKKNAVKSKSRIEIINRGLTYVKSKSFISAKAQYLDDYIKSKRYNSSYAIAMAESLVGQSDLAEILIAQVYIDDANHTSSESQKEDLFLKALAIKTTHNAQFNQLKYNALLPQIITGISDISKKLYKTDPNHALLLLYKLRENNLDWFDVYVTLKLETISTQQPSKALCSSILAILDEGAGIHTNSIDRLWTKYADISIELANSCNPDEAITLLQEHKLLIENKCTVSCRDILLSKIGLKFLKLLYNRGKQYEKASSYAKAIADYQKVLTISGIKYADVTSRIYICKLKNHDLISDADSTIISNILNDNKSKDYQKDLAYRWCLYLINEGHLDEAKQVNTFILENDPELVQICQEEEIKRQHYILIELNNQIDKLNNSQLTANEAISMGKSLSKTIRDLNLIVHISSQKQAKLKGAIRVYAIEKFYEEGQFIQSINGLKVQDAEYLSDPVALRNIAIMCLRAAEEGLLTNENYKELIALWATAIYQQKIFVKSLDFTTWDDPYTFTLENALGHLDECDELPENVNYADASDSGVVSIFEVQKALINRMDSALNNHHEYQQFFSAQIEAMDKLSEQNLDMQCVVVAPYLAAMSTAYMASIKTSLTNEANSHYGNWETILDIGRLYGITNGDFGRYSEARIALQQIIESLKNKSHVRTTITSNHISLIQNFDGLRSNLVSVASTVVNNGIAENVGYTQLNSDFGYAVRVISDDTLSFTFSNYINQQVVTALNNKTISLATGASILIDIHSYCKCNPHLNRNIENIVEALVQNYITDGDAENITLLDRILTSNRMYDTYVVNALKGKDDQQTTMLNLIFMSNEANYNILKSKISSKSRIIQSQFNQVDARISEMKVQLELSSIVQGVNESSMQKNVALEKVYNLYKSNKNNANVCKNLATLIPMCIMEYIIPDKVGKAKVETVLNSLKLNISTTFKQNNSEIGQAYTLIWSQLPFDARSAIQNSPWTLNEQGKALKKGVDYLKALS